MFKKLFIISTTIFSALFFMASSARAANLDVQFQNTPLFSEANFAPGQSVTRWVKVTNNTGNTQKIITDTVNKTDPDHLADQMNIVIKEGATELYSDTLAHFFSAERYLSDLAGNGTQTQYDFTITFNADANDDYQGKTLGFDFIIGFLGQEGGQIQPTTSGTITGGAPLPSGLTISNESLPVVEQTSVTITWLTSYNSTSYVIYGTASESHTLNLSDTAGTPPQYGYAHATPEIDTSPRVTFHTVTITGLIPGTTYYYRAVSHGSLAIGQEFTFTTKGVAGVTTEETNLPTEQSLTTGGGQTGTTGATTGGGANQGEVLGAKTSVGAQGLANNEGNNTGAQSNSNLVNFLASIASMPMNWKIIILIIIIAAIVLIVLWVLGRKKKNRFNKQ